MAAAAKNLTPVTLELGGKCPAILDSLSSKRDRDVSQLFKNITFSARRRLPP